MVVGVLPDCSKVDISCGILSLLNGFTSLLSGSSSLTTRRKYVLVMQFSLSHFASFTADIRMCVHVSVSASKRERERERERCRTTPDSSRYR